MSLIGILTPQANTTVEQEMRILLEAPFITARLTCPSGDSRTRLLQYFHGVHDTAAQFDVAPIDVIGFACTGSSYLVENEEASFAGGKRPIVSAAAAVRDALRELGACRIALLSPYPEWLTKACVAFWSRHHIEVAHVASPAGERADTRRIYSLDHDAAAAAFAKLDTSKADAVLVSGTGMPSLRLIASVKSAVPVLSSNLCLAWRLSDSLSSEPIGRWVAADAAWRKRIP
jgi:maleate cis-trans isomerase